LLIQLKTIFIVGSGKLWVESKVLSVVIWAVADRENMSSRNKSGVFIGISPKNNYKDYMIATDKPFKTLFYP
jgi:hypothetical protein